MEKDNEKLEHMRHSLAHLLAAAVLEIWPEALPAIGPVIQDGFYYDFEFPEPISNKDLSRIEEMMREILPSWKEFERIEVTQKDAKERFKNNSYKLELIDEFTSTGEELTLYKSGDFIDLCRGGHVEHPAKDINPDAFKLTHVAGAYWRGDEKNKMLTRIYGAAFETKEELDESLKIREEAEKRDHRRLGKEMGLFTFSEMVGAGLPMFTPKGTLVRNQIERYLEELQLPKGYKKVWIPHLAKKELYVTSGHWEKFADDIFHVTTKSEADFVLKPMNCPHHTQIYASQPRSYRDLPVRYFEVTAQYRNEKPGQLHGLTRVRSITIDDAHIFCRPDQVEEEAKLIYDIVEEYYRTFNMKLVPRLSIREAKNQENYIGDPEIWDSAEKQLRKILEKRVGSFEEIEGEAAFYGPKIDFEAEDVLGRKWQLATIQLDFAMPQRFGLEFTNEKGEKETPVMIHRAVAGSLERFMAILIEHYAGAFPLWLSPVQVKVLPIAEAHKEYAKRVFDELSKNDIRAELDNTDETLNKKIRNWKLEKVPYAVVIGTEEVDAKKITVESRDGEQTKDVSVKSLIDKLGKEISEKK